MSDCSCRAIEFMLSVKNEKNFQGMNELGMRFVVRFIESIKHVQEVFYITCVFMRLIIFSTDSMTIGIGSNSRNTS